jgi:hypothetical protein
LIFIDRDINKGEELTISYASKLNYQYPFRSYTCQSRGFECRCDLCTYDRVDLDATLGREAFVAQELPKVQSQLNDLTRVNKFVDTVRSKYADQRPERLMTCLYEPLSVLAHSYSHNRDDAKAAECSRKVFDLAKGVLEEEAQRSLIKAFKLYKRLGRQPDVTTSLLLWKESAIGDRAYFSHMCERYL